MKLFHRRPAWTPPTGEYVEAFRSRDGSFVMEHMNGIDWLDAPTPPYRHKCYAQTRSYVNYFERVYRCACGAIWDRGHWMERNTKLKEDRQERAKRGKAQVNNPGISDRKNFRSKYPGPLFPGA